MMMNLDMAKQATEKVAPRKTRQREKEPFLSEPQDGAGEVAPKDIGGNHRILIVDDNPVVLKAFESKLKSDGFAVTATPSPSSVATLVEKTKAELVILDMNFPPEGAMEWNGFTIVRWLRRFSTVGTLPLIVVSGAEQPALRDECLALGVTAFFVKPVRYQDLLASVVQALVPKAG